MKSKLNRIETLVQSFSDEGEVNIDHICTKMGISTPTLKRYLAELRTYGFEIINKQGKLTLGKQGEMPTEDDLSRITYLDFQILLLIYNNPVVTRQKFIEVFCREDYFTSVKENVTEKTLDNHLGKLCGLKYISKMIKDNEVVFSITDRFIPKKGFDFQKTLCLINYLKIYENSLPFHKETENIIEKLEITCLNHLRQSVEAKENILFAQEIFPDCVIQVDEPEEENIINVLEDQCLNGIAIEVEMKSGGHHEIRPFLIVFNWHMGCWYLVFRYLSDDEGFDLFRLDHIRNFRALGYKKLDSGEVEKEISAARDEIEESFLFSMEKESEVEVYFLEPDKDELEEIDRLMKRTRNMQKEQLRGNNYRFIVNIKGTTDFLAWIRRFGSKVLIGNSTLGEMHMHTAIQALAKLSVPEFGG